MIVLKKDGTIESGSVDNVPIEAIYNMLLDAHAIVDDEFVGLAIGIGGLQYIVQMDDTKIYIQTKEL
jgi:hypothetical protein